MRAAVLDLGSNSFHVLVAEVDGASVVPVVRSRDMLHLGREVAATGGIGPAARDRARATAERLATVARRAGAEHIAAVATAALRDARDGTTTLEAMSRAAGVPIEALPGTEEARLAHLGATAAVSAPDGEVLVLDLGGGSLEIARGRRGAAPRAVSLPIGVSRASAGIDRGPLGEETVAALRATVGAALGDAARLVRPPVPPAIAVGGTARALARLDAATHGRWLPASVNAATLDLADLTAARRVLAALPLEARAALPGMKGRRADHLHVAAVLWEAVLLHLDLHTMTVSDWGLREGLLLDRFGSPGRSARRLRDSEVARLRAAFRADDEHPDRVADLAARLLDATADRHDLGPRERAALIDAARLHTVGRSLALRRSHEHGAYVVEHAELRGFPPADLALVVTLVRFHPSRGIDPTFPAYAAMPREEQRRARLLLAMLRVADVVDAEAGEASATVRAVRSGDLLRVEQRRAGRTARPTDVRRGLTDAIGPAQRVLTEELGLTVDLGGVAA